MQNTIIRIPLDKLLPHPENPNRMAKANFEKLKRHIKQSHNYEPLIIRKHPEIENHFQIINGHHRAAALKQLGETFADCVQWDVDDDAAEFEIRQVLGDHKSFAPLGTLFETTSMIFGDAVISRLMEITKTDESALKNRHANIE